MTDPLDRLEKLTNLYERGALTAEEFETQKTRLLASGVADWDERAPMQNQGEQKKRRALLIGGGFALVLACLALVGSLLLPWDEEPAAAVTNDALAVASLEKSVAFADPASCRPSETFQTFLDDLHQAGAAEGESIPVRLAAVHGDVPLETVTGTRNGKEVRLSAGIVAGDWQGLQLRRVIAIRWTDGLADGFRLEFADAPQRTVKVVKALGLPVESSGKLAEGDKVLVHVGPSEMGSALSCYPRESRPETVPEQIDGNASDV